MVTWDTGPELEEELDSFGSIHETRANTDHTNDGIVEHGPEYNPDMTSGLVVWYPLAHDGDPDLSGNGNDGTSVGGPTRNVWGRMGLPATFFDGSDDQIEIPSLSLGDSTFCFWFRFHTTNTGTRQTLHRKRTSDGYNIICREAGGTLYVEQYDGSNWQTITVGSVSPNQWYFIAYTSDNSSGALEAYLDGSSVGSVSTAYNDTNSVGHTIGSSPYDQSWANATISDFRTYDRVLSSSEIQALYNWGNADLARDATDGISRYQLDGDATDSWGSNDLTVNGSPSYVSNAIRGQSANYDGSSDYHSGGPTVPSTSFTMSVWVYVDSLSTGHNHTYIGDNTGNNSYTGAYLEANESGPNLRFSVGDGSTWQNATYPISSQKWYLTTGVYDGTDHFLYVNDVLVDTYSGTNYSDSSNSLHLGREAHGNWSNYLDGKLDDARIYDYALTHQQVHELYRWGTLGIDMSKKTVKY